MSGLRDDFLFSLRQLRRQPGFALIVIVTLGSAMGISTALFSITDNSWSKQWPVPEADSIVSTAMLYSVDEARFWQENATSFLGLSAEQHSFTRHRIEGRRVFYDFVATNYFDVLKIPIVLGRRFADDDTRLFGTEPEAVISYRMWEERFRRDPRIVGSRIALGNSRFTVAGVAASGFEGPGRFRRHLWFALSARETFGSALPIKTTVVDTDPREVQVFGRLRPGVTPDQGQAELSALNRRFRVARGLKPYPVVPMDSAASNRQTRSTLRDQASVLTMLLAITFLCMIACANVSNLMLARGLARRGEFAVRLSLGATRAQLIRQLLIESLILALLAGLLGIAVASAIPAHIFGSLPDLWEMARIGFELDRRVFVWTLLMSALACVVFGLAPALSTTRLSAGQVLKDANGQSGGSLRTSLTSMQAFVSVMALGMAGLVLRSSSFSDARALSQRMEPLVIVRPTAPPLYDEARLGLLKGALLDRLAAVSGAHNVAVAGAEPRLVSAGERANLEVSASFFGLMGQTVVEGRNFASTDPVDRVVILSETLAKVLWPGESAVGKTLEATAAGTNDREVIGVVRDRASGETVSYGLVPPQRMNVFLVRDSAERFRAQAASLVTSVDPNLQAEVVSGRLWLTQASPGAVMTMQVFGEFGAFALALTAVGLFSLSEYLVRQRTREIGIRTSLGARPRHILSAIFRPATRSLTSGLLAGTGAAVAAGFVMRSNELPAGVEPLDPTNYALAALLMIVTGLLAMWRPAAKATKVEPGEALRYE
jgi:putative ABC transport system permease protein